mmetsp:Transcript_47205/g.152461  ORF Transcript_47205/g.152461 Transcript_47205/m.152461 type:complete len:335 (+) Transcript_47205:2-1006(+)
MDLMCPISACLFRDPVMLVSGHTFERASIVEFWRRRPLANPLGTGERLRSAQMIVNYGYRSQVDAWLQRHPDYTPEGWSSRGGVHRCTQEELDRQTAEIESAARDLDDKAAAEAAAEEEEARRELASEASRAEREIGRLQAQMTAERDDALERERQFCQRRLGEMSAQFEEQMVSLRRCQAAAAAAELEEAGQRDRRAVSRLEVELGESSRAVAASKAQVEALRGQLDAAKAAEAAHEEERRRWRVEAEERLAERGAEEAARVAAGVSRRPHKLDVDGVAAVWPSSIRRSSSGENSRKEPMTGSAATSPSGPRSAAAMIALRRYCVFVCSRSCA